MSLHKRLMNKSEAITHQIILEAIKFNQAQLFSKVRIADVLIIENSGISSDLYSYALKAHFDFVVTNSDFLPLFCIEFDGPHHQTDRVAQLNDKKKESLCARFDIPLLRITADFLNKKIRRFTLLGWLIELWFLEQAFYEGQEQGLIPDDESFLYFAILADSTEDFQKGKLTFPYDLSFPSRAYIAQCYRSGHCLDLLPSVYHTKNIDGHIEGLAIVRISNSSIVIGHARCCPIQFTPVSGEELCRELATIAVMENLKFFIAGKQRPSTIAQVQAEFARLESIALKTQTKVYYASGGGDLRNFFI